MTTRHNNKTFRQLYDEQRERDRKRITYAQRFVTKVAEITQKSELTVRAWISGTQRPGELERTMIAELLGADKKALFPQKAKQNGADALKAQ